MSVIWGVWGGGGSWDIEMKWQCEFLLVFWDIESRRISGEKFSDGILIGKKPTHEIYLGNGGKKPTAQK